MSTSFVDQDGTTRFRGEIVGGSLGSAPPQLHNMLAWTFDAMLGGAGSSVTSGDLVLAKVWVPTPMTFAEAVVFVEAPGTVLTYARLGLYDAAGIRVAQTASLITEWEGTTADTLRSPFAAPYSHPGGSFVMVGFLAVGATVPTFAASTSSSASDYAVGLAAADGYRGAKLAGQAALPATVSYGATAYYDDPFFAGLA